MKGVFGWFDSRGKNFKLAEYYSGWVFDSRDAYIEFVGMLNRYGSTYDGLSVSEDESGRYMSNPDAKYPEIPESKLGSTVKAIWSKGQAFKFTGSTCIGSAADVAITFNYNESDLRLNKQLDARIKSWNDHNKHKGNIIGLDDILKAAS
jgi:hypothetical protein